LKNKAEAYYTYVVRCADGSYYTGWTRDVDQRVAAHNSGRGAKYTRSRQPVVLVWSQAFTSKHAAMHWEWQIKQWPRAKKADLVCRQLLLPDCAKGEGQGETMEEMDTDSTRRHVSG
jgi:putative endonuclease